MHYHLEIIMPPSQDIEKDIASIMKPFSENNEDADVGFWDWYVIGGRMAGSKEMCAYGEDKLSAFFKELQEKKVTVSSLQCGKQSIEPASQIPLVDGIWNKHFPTENGEIIACPIFDHSNNQYDGSDLLSCDICLVEDIPDNFECFRVIIAGPGYNDSGMEAQYMTSQDIWNGVNHIKTEWGGNVKESLDQFQAKCLKHYTDEYKEKYTPKDNWICVTVDYHC